MQVKSIESISKVSFFNFFIYSCFIIFIQSIGFAQTKQIKGHILLSEKLREISNIYVQNKNTNKYTLTNALGEFNLEASLGDTLMFFGDFLKNRKIVITKERLTSEKLIIPMESEYIELNELVIKTLITGNLKADLARISYTDTISYVYKKLGLDIKQRDLKRREKKADLFKKVGGIPIPTSLDIETLYKTITGYYKKEQNFLEYSELDDTAKGLLKLIPKAFFNEYLKIPQEETFNFVFFSVETDKPLFSKLLKNNSSIEIKILLENKSKIYLGRLDK